MFNMAVNFKMRGLFMYRLWLWVFGAILFKAQLCYFFFEYFKRSLIHITYREPETAAIHTDKFHISLARCNAAVFAQQADHVN